MKILTDAEFIMKNDGFVMNTTRWYKLWYKENGKEKNTIAYGGNVADACRLAKIKSVYDKT